MGYGGEMLARTKKRAVRKDCRGVNRALAAQEQRVP